MAQYDIPTPNTLLFRMFSVDDGVTALRLLDTFGPAGTLPAQVTLCTLADVSSGSEAAPLAACAVAHDPGSHEAWLDRFVVAVPFRGRGLARRLVSETATALRAQGVRRVYVRSPGDEALLRRLLVAGVIWNVRPAGPWWDGPSAGEDGSARSWSAYDL